MLYVYTSFLLLILHLEFCTLNIYFETISKSTKALIRSEPLDFVFLGAVHTKIDLRSIWDRSQFALRKCSHSFRSTLDRSQFAFERSHSDRFGLRSSSDRSNSLVWMAPYIGSKCTIFDISTWNRGWIWKITICITISLPASIWSHCFVDIEANSEANSESVYWKLKWTTEDARFEAEERVLKFLTLSLFAMATQCVQTILRQQRLIQFIKPT